MDSKIINTKLPLSYYLTNDVVEFAKNCIGKLLCTNVNNEFASGIIIETEAYAGIEDKASHAYGGKRSKRTEAMYDEGGIAYVYLCYGMHHMFNIVTNIKNTPHAVLIRGIFPIHGLETMAKRVNKKMISYKDGIGPGKTTKILGINIQHNKEMLTGGTIWLSDTELNNNFSIVSGKRIGIDYAEEDRFRPYRFYLKDLNQSTFNNL